MKKKLTKKYYIVLYILTVILFFSSCGNNADKVKDIETFHMISSEDNILEESIIPIKKGDEVFEKENSNTTTGSITSGIKFKN